jgi:colanic acid biosynthesis glycosyl transferase WcaI
LRILLITQWFEPEPMFKGLSFARALRDRGHEVEVLTGFPNYPEGRLYEGYRLRAWQKDVMDGISVTRAPLYPSHDSSAPRRIANYASFAVSASLVGSVTVRGADVAYVYHPPATIALPAMTMRLLRRTPVVMDVQDLWPETLGATGMVRSRMLMALAGAWCRLTYRVARAIVVLSPGFKARLVERGVPAGKIEVIYNWCDESAIRPEPPDQALRARLGLEGRFNVVFAGTLGKAQGLESVLKAARLVAGTAPRAQFVFVGAGTEAERLRRIADESGLANVRFLPRRPPSEIGAVLALADVLLVHLRDDPLFAITVPSKTQAYLAAGKPILMAVRGDAAALVERAGAGMVCPPGDPGGLATAVAELSAAPADQLAAMGCRGRDFYRRELSMDVGVARFEAVFERVRRPNRRAGRADVPPETGMVAP